MYGRNAGQVVEDGAHARVKAVLRALLTEAEKFTLRDEGAAKVNEAIARELDHYFTKSYILRSRR